MAGEPGIIERSLVAAQREAGEVNLSVTEFHHAARNGQWERAEAARNAAAAHFEAQLDAFLLGYREAARIGGGE